MMTPLGASRLSESPHVCIIPLQVAHRPRLYHFLNTVSIYTFHFLNNGWP